MDRHTPSPRATSAVDSSPVTSPAVAAPPPPAPRRRRSWKRRALVAFGLLALLVVGTFFGWGLVEARLLSVSGSTLTSPHLPSEFDGTRVVYLADVHAGPYYSRERVAKLVDRVNALEPDLILLGGDYVGGRGHGAANFYPEVRRLRARHGVYAVLGNHDYWEGEAEARSQFAAAGIRVLDNVNVPIRRGDAEIRVGGVEDLWEGEADVASAGRGVTPDSFAMLVTHNADVLANGLPRNARTWDLAMAGHTHGGQVTFFGRGPAIVPSEFGYRYLKGWSEERGCRILVTRGVGAVTLPVRFFARPEVNLITLERGQEVAVRETSTRQ